MTSLVSLSLGYTRFCIGFVAVASPATTSSLFGFNEHPTTGSDRLRTRLFGVRELALGAGLAGLLGEEVCTVRGFLAACAIVDGVDVVAAVMAYNEGSLNNTGVLLIIMGAAAFCGLNVYEYRVTG
ncbi:hypothetical protein SARC_12529 [Sphaeroforma arctica JP610]|uniref:Uncharacterized protein n=1 Tax=Sphaeroforma arctica JP610 TaxID=667725 RepID=A0A0L0FEN3_9EUKA|nr:hypothetical protein SARC_12529 [Sphaeroforma arctica JP610]KNC74936.1 hypothetical protein SARC_12529 [Sphaeroforma arctica JP610]|eukprot:XP_014148838.1 hypothetical protein SARC_12529 [Sphaeroforma arctica JP610]